eukprot:1191351-Prorocentrum_minimum.AAC.2
MSLIDERNEEVTPMGNLSTADIRGNHKAFRNMVRGPPVPPSLPLASQKRGGPEPHFEPA